LATPKVVHDGSLAGVVVDEPATDEPAVEEPAPDGPTAVDDELWVVG
jgi:hypothetical protein